MKRMTSLLAVLALTLPVIAQETLDEPEEIKRYTVEVIIFSYAKDVSTGTEIFVPDVIDVEDPGALEDPGAISQLEPVGRRHIDHLNLVRLNRDEFSLNDVRDRMQRLDVYKPLMHFGWTQSAWPEEDTPAIELRQFGRPPVGLDGSLTLYLRRYLHLVVDLEMAGASESRGAGLYGSITGPVRYRISEDRILKNGEIRYFDHPKFGMLAKVTRIEEEEPAEPELDSLSGRLRE